VTKIPALATPMQTKKKGFEPEEGVLRKKTKRRRSRFEIVLKINSHQQEACTRRNLLSVWEGVNRGFGTIPHGEWGASRKSWREGNEEEKLSFTRRGNDYQKKKVSEGRKAFSSASQLKTGFNTHTTKICDGGEIGPNSASIIII